MAEPAERLAELSPGRALGLKGLSARPARILTWMKHLILALALALPAWSQNIRIQDKRFEGRYLFRRGQIHVLLEPFAQALEARLSPLGDGYYAALQDTPGPASVPAATLQVGDKQIPLLLETGDVYVPAEPFCQALGLNTSRDAGGVLCVKPRSQAAQTLRRPIPANPASFFVTQYKSRYNPSGPVQSANCGPACMAMVALAYGLTPEGLVPGDRQGLIGWCREAMTLGGQSPNRATTCNEVERLATRLGLKSRWLRHYRELDGALAQGQLVMVGGDIGKIGGKGGSHFLLCLGKSGSDYLINDPGGYFPAPGTRLTPGDMEGFFYEAIALY